MISELYVSEIGLTVTRCTLAITQTLIYLVWYYT